MGGARVGKVKRSKEQGVEDQQRSFFAQARNFNTPAFVRNQVPSAGAPKLTPGRVPRMQQLQALKGIALVRHARLVPTCS